MPGAWNLNLPSLRDNSKRRRKPFFGSKSHCDAAVRGSRVDFCRRLKVIASRHEKFTAVPLKAECTSKPFLTPEPEKISLTALKRPHLKPSQKSRHSHKTQNRKTPPELETLLLTLYSQCLKMYWISCPEISIVSGLLSNKARHWHQFLPHQRWHFMIGQHEKCKVSAMH